MLMGSFGQISALKEREEQKICQKLKEVIFVCVCVGVFVCVSGWHRLREAPSLRPSLRPSLHQSLSLPLPLQQQFGFLSPVRAICLSVFCFGLMVPGARNLC